MTSCYKLLYRQPPLHKLETVICAAPHIAGNHYQYSTTASPLLQPLGSQLRWQLLGPLLLSTGQLQLVTAAAGDGWYI